MLAKNAKKMQEEQCRARRNSNAKDVPCSHRPDALFPDETAFLMLAFLPQPAADSLMLLVRALSFGIRPMVRNSSPGDAGALDAHDDGALVDQTALRPEVNYSRLGLATAAIAAGCCIRPYPSW